MTIIDKDEVPPLEVIKQEVQNCADSKNGPIYFLNNYGRIRTEDKGIVDFKLLDYQEEIIRELISNKYLAILKSRQVGITTIISGFIAWYMLFRKERHIFVMATKHEKAAISLEMVKTFINECPKWLNLFHVEKNNTRFFKLSNGSWLKASSTTKDVGVGEAASFFFIDEAALVDKLDEYWKRLFPTIAVAGRCVVASTPNGVGNKFWEICMNGSRLINGELAKGTNEFKVLEYPWSRRYPKEWFEKEITGKSRRDIAQEYECKFLESGDTFLDTPAINEIKSNIKEPTVRYGDLWIWELPKQGHSYIIAADVARGDGSDHSAFNVIDLASCTVCADYKSKIKTDEFSVILLDTAKKYNNALLVPEANTFGDAVIQNILKENYENLYYHAFDDYISFWDALSNKLAKPGMRTTLKTRPLMLQKMEEYIRNKKIAMYSERLHEEFTTFIWKNGRPEATRGYSDDLIMSLAIGILVYEQVGGKEINRGTTEDFEKYTLGFRRSKVSFGQFYDNMNNQTNRNTQDELNSFMELMIRRK